MSYRRNSDLPAAVRKMPVEAQTYWRGIYNEALVRGMEMEKSKDLAWAAVKRSWTEKEGEWIRKGYSSDELRAFMGLARAPRKFVELLLKNASALQKVAPDDIDYRPSEDEGESCSSCMHFHDGRCDVLDQEVDPDYVSDRFRRPEETVEESYHGGGSRRRGGRRVPRRTKKELEVTVIQEGEEAPEDTVPLLKANDEARYTFAPIYAPDELDAHNEFVTKEDLEKAIWGYVQKGDRTVRFQHGQAPAGEWVNIFVSPFDFEATLKLPNGLIEKREFKEGTAFMGVIWRPDVWNMIKAGKITGLSMGGFAQRVEIADYSEE